MPPLTLHPKTVRLLTEEAVIEVPTAAGGGAAPSLRRMRPLYFNQRESMQGH